VKRSQQRPSSIGMRQLVRSRELTIENHWRPEIRSDCKMGPRPCPYVGCKYNLYLDVLVTGSIKFNFPGLEPDQMSETCTLDVTDCGSLTLEAVGLRFNVTRERIRQIEARALMRLEKKGLDLREFLDHNAHVQYALE